MPNFTALDFETANRYRASPCQVGLVKVHGGAVTDERTWLIKPPQQFSTFDPFNTSIHGITADMVADAPPWRDVIHDMMDFIEDDAVVAHNAAFDIGVMRHACIADNVSPPSTNFLCTLMASRRILTLASYRLPFVTNALGISMQQHHDALSDARAAAEIAMVLCHKVVAQSIEELAERCGLSMGALLAGGYTGCSGTQSGTRSARIDVTGIDIDPDGYFDSKTVVFTGALQSMTRADAHELIRRAGGIPQGSPTRATNILVIGSLDPKRLRPDAKLSRKAERARELQESGQDIELITEADFLQMLEIPTAAIP